jgi:hypothetical protein
MSNKTQIEELFSLAQEANRYASLENQLLRAEISKPQSNGESLRRIHIGYKSAGSENASIKNKLHFSYGL